MSRKTWASVDDYIVDALFEADPALDAVLAANHDQGLPAIDVSPAQGKLLSLLARIQGREEDPRDRHAGRLFDDLDGARTGCRWHDRDAGTRFAPRQGRALEF